MATPTVFVPVLPLGAFPFHQGRDQIAHTARSARLDPDVCVITEGLVHDVNILDELPIEPGAIYITPFEQIPVALLFARGPADFDTTSASNDTSISLF